MPVLTTPAILSHSLTFLYFLDIFLLALYGFYALFQTAICGQSPQPLSEAETAPNHPSLPSPLPTVTVQLPVYNEQHVVHSLIEAVAALDWPGERLQIQILDDSTDDTTEKIGLLLERLAIGSRALTVEHLHRRDRQGFKAGALQQGLSRATGEFIAIFDADFVPPADFLRRTLPAFDDPTIACVQTRWGHLNAESSFLTLAQSVGIDGHFAIEQQARDRMGALLNFNGTAGVLRKHSLEAVGGWQGDTLTEDLDLSYRLQLQDWRIVYLPAVVVPAELPVQLYGLQRQQFRWAKGSIQTAQKLGLTLWRSPQPFWRKVLGTLHLTQYAVHPLMVLNLLLILPVGLNNPMKVAALPLVMLSSLGPSLMYWMAMGADGLPPARRLRRIAMLLILGTGFSINNSRAVLEALLGIKSEFQRTPKFAVVDPLTPWQTSSYVLSGGLQVWVELLLCLYALGLWGYSFHLGAWWVLPWLTLYGGGYGTMVMLKGFQAWQRSQMLTEQAAIAAISSSASSL